MLKKKSSNIEKKRKYSRSEERQESGKRRSSEVHTENPKDDLADPELDRIGSDIEEGGLDLSMPFRAITAYMGDRKEMLEQCFHVLGEKKLRRMLPDELKDSSLEEIKALCWEQLQPICNKTLVKIFAGEDFVPVNENAKVTSESQQDSNIDSTSSCKETTKNEDKKQEGGGFGEESDVLNISVDAYDSDIEEAKEELDPKAAKATNKAFQTEGDLNPQPPNQQRKKDIQSDIDKSVSEILAISALNKKEANELSGEAKPADVSLADQSGPHTCGGQPSVQQLALLELEMRARAIKALMKASDGKQPSATKNS